MPTRLSITLGVIRRVGFVAWIGWELYIAPVIKDDEDEE